MQSGNVVSIGSRAPVRGVMDMVVVNKYIGHVATGISTEYDCVGQIVEVVVINLQICGCGTVLHVDAPRPVMHRIMVDRNITPRREGVDTTAARSVIASRSCRRLNIEIRNQEVLNFDVTRPADYDSFCRLVIGQDVAIRSVLNHSAIGRGTVSASRSKSAWAAAVNDDIAPSGNINRSARA